jgi:uncharacterized membrane protein YkvA (DUF1232 family)
MNACNKSDTMTSSPPPSSPDRWRDRVRALKRDVVAIALAVRDPRVPWYAKAVGACVVAYALSPIDLIPDFIPVLGLVDDLVLVPLGLLLMVRLIPADILAEHRRAAATVAERPVSWAGAAAIVAVWVLAAVLTAALAARAFGFDIVTILGGSAPS